jgi:putative ABC transport system substrate-binding protein
MMITRGVFAVVLALGLLAAPWAADAQEPGKVPRIGVLGPTTRSDSAPWFAAFRRGLRELGWVEGQNISLEYRWAEGRTERLLDLAAELVRLRVDVMLVGATAPAVAARNATRTIPIVMATSGDPVGMGLVASLARPGGNVTGLTVNVGVETFGKNLELLREAVPKVRRVAVLSNPASPYHVLGVKHVKAAAQPVDVQLHFLEARGPDDLDRAFAAMARARAEALFVLPDPTFLLHRARLHDLAAKSRLPAMYALRQHTETGGLMSYGVDLRDNYRRAATYVDKILKGAKPADLPIEQPTKFELVINLKTAKALGLTIPASMLARADEAIQ